MVAEKAPVRVRSEAKPRVLTLTACQGDVPYVFPEAGMGKVFGDSWITAVEVCGGSPYYVIGGSGPTGDHDHA